MVASGLVVGFATGGFPEYSKEISQVALVLGMTFSLTEISILGISPRTEVRRFVVAFAMSYLVLSGLILSFAVLSPDPQIRNGWVLMAAVPPAIAVVALGRTFLLGGVVFVLTRTLRVPWAERVAVTAFSSFKNLGLTVVLAFAVFGPVATLPSIVSLVFEILWLAALPLLFRADMATAASAA